MHQKDRMSRQETTPAQLKLSLQGRLSSQYKRRQRDTSPTSQPPKGTLHRCKQTPRKASNKAMKAAIKVALMHPNLL